MDNTRAPTPLDQFLNVSVRLAGLGALMYIAFMFFNGKPSGFIILAAALFIFLVVYVNGRYYLQENFKDCSVPVENSASRPYATNQINELDDYEYNSVFANEIDREISKDLRNKLMSQYPLDWSTQPPSSSQFQSGLKEHFENMSKDALYIDNSDNLLPYENITEHNLTPPDTSQLEMEERRILQTYVPKETNDLNSYSPEDAYSLIKRIYDAKGLIPHVEHTKDTNIYEITGVRSKDEKIVFEDNEETKDYTDAHDETIIKVPQGATDFLNTNDPFYDTRTRTRVDRWDYTKYTPGLERMFAPTYPHSQWY